MDPDPMDYVEMAMTMVNIRRRGYWETERMSIAWEAITRCMKKWDPSKAKFGTLLRFYVLSSIQNRMRWEEGNLGVPQTSMANGSSIACFSMDDIEDMGLSYEEDPRRDRDEIAYVIGLLLEHLTTRQAYVVEAYLSKSVDSIDLSRQLGISRQRVHQMAMHHLERIRRVIADDNNGHHTPSASR